MRSFKISFQVVFLLVISIGGLLGGCANQSIFSAPPNTILLQDNAGIQAEITRLEEIRENVLLSPVEPQLFLSLCLLYSNPNNEQPDYRRAQEMLETYTNLQADAVLTNDVLYLTSLLMQINHLKGEQDALTGQYDTLKRDAASLEADNAAVKEKNAHLISENKRLQDIIEQLKLLDIRLEERRNAF